MAGNTAVLTSISDVGKKTAQRLIVELKDRLEDLEIDGASPISGGSAEKTAARKDALAALESLGVSRADAERSLRKVLRNQADIDSADQLVRLALKER